jgi:FkbM family methyltransferase
VTAITQIGGLYWPKADTCARQIILRDCEPDVASMLKHTPGRSVIVQAGGNVGVYPLALADHFNCVITFEPDPDNWACLEKNLAARDSLRRVVAHRAALGETDGLCVPVEVDHGNTGAHRVDFGTGDVPVMTIDGLSLERCDGIWLDIEGSEWFALKGAEQTIARFAPTIRVEDKGLDRRFFGIEPGSLQAWLSERGYSEVDRIGRDKVFLRRDR